MKQKIFLPVLILQMLFVTSCWYRTSTNTNDLDFIVEASELELNTNKPNKGRSSNTSSRGGLCEDDKDCIDICEDVYNFNDDSENEGQVRLCEELRYRVASKFEDLLEVLEESDINHLRTIDTKVFTAFVNVSLDPWVEEVTKNLSKKKSEALLSWIAKESVVAKAITDAYNNYEDIDLYAGVTELFEEITPSSPTVSFPTTSNFATIPAGNLATCKKMYYAIKVRKISGSRSFSDITAETSNSAAITISEVICKNACDDAPTFESDFCGA